MKSILVLLKANDVNAVDNYVSLPTAVDDYVQTHVSLLVLKGKKHILY